MNRRIFIEKSIAASALLTTGMSHAFPYGKQNTLKEKLLNAYYFRAHMYTMVPSQVAEDMQRMADIGTDAVTVAILEQDLFAAVENVEIIANEADKKGIKLFVVPSRWGGMFAGAPKVPSLFSVQNPHTWILLKDGKPRYNNVSGVISSVHYPETFDFFCESITKMMALWPIKGIVWDEPKSYLMDYSPKAIENLGADASLSSHVRAVSDFHGRINAFIKEGWSDVTTNLFSYADLDDELIDIIAQTKKLDYFGCDGRPWYPNDGGVDESVGKTLLKNGERFLSAARKHKVNSLWLIENHNMKAKDMELAKNRLPEVISKDVDQLIYYYYPRNLSNPADNMDLIFEQVAQFKK